MSRSPRGIPIVEAATAALYVAVVAANWGDAAAIALGVAFVTLLVPVTLIDLEHQIIPNKLTGPFAIVAVAIGAALDPSGRARAADRRRRRGRRSSSPP